MSKTFKFIPVLFFAAILVSSCEKSNSTTCDSSRFPFLQTGHRLTYSIYGFLSGSFTPEDYVFNIGSKDANDNYLLTFDPNPNLSSALLTPQYRRACGSKLSAGAVPVLDDANCSMDLDVAAGGSWTKQGTNGITTTYRVIADNVPITVQAGTYNCKVLTYRQTGGINTDSIFWNNQVGYVKYVGLGVAYELKSKNF